MTPSEIGRLVRQWQHDAAFRTSVRAGDLEVLRREGYDLDETERQALCAIGSQMSETDPTASGASRPWYWALKFQTEYITKFEARIQPGQESNYENWFLQLKQHVAARTYNGHAYKGMVLLKSGQWYRWAIDWFDSGAAQRFKDTEAGGDQGGGFLNTNFPTGMFTDGSITHANFKDFVQVWDDLDEVESQKFVQLSGLAVDQEEWILPNAADHVPFRTAQIQRMNAISGNAAFSTVFKGGLVEQGRPPAQTTFLVLTSFDPAFDEMALLAAHPWVSASQFSGASGPTIKKYTIR